MTYPSQGDLQSRLDWATANGYVSPPSPAPQEIPPERQAILDATPSQPPPPSPTPTTGGNGGYSPGANYGGWVLEPDAPGTGTGAGTRPPLPSTGNPAVDAILQALSYGNGVYQNLPVLQYLMGNLSQGEFDTVSSTDTYVPQLGITIPGPGRMNYQVLSNIKQNSPGSFELLKALFAAGNRDLDNEMALSRRSAPLGSAYQPSLIAT